MSQKKDTISLGIGQPDFSTMPEVINSVIVALKEGKGSVYAPTRGVPKFKQVIAEKLKKENGIGANPDENVIVTPGGSGAIELAFAAVFNQGDEALFFSPNFVSYFYVAPFFDAKVVESPRNNNLEPDFDEFKKLISDRTKAIIINSPNNPTGNILSKKEVEEIAGLCNEHDLYLISDECYEKFVYDSNAHVSPGSLNGMEDRVITLNATSKTFSTTGWRIGYIHAKSEIITLMENFLQYTAAGSNHPLQYGGITAMEMMLEKPDLIDDIIKVYQKKRDICYKRLNDMGLACPKPGGAFYIMPSVASTGLSGFDFSEKLIEEKGVAVVPGGIFGSHSKDRMRISYALGESLLAEALDRIEDFKNRL
ncbi:MAG: pyridoxal phosphate-dependent aminotransferase [Candidatus Hodarchaeota archaeon]